MRAAIAIGLVASVAACKAKPEPEPAASSESPGSATPRDAAVDANLDGCRAALPKIAALPSSERPQALIDACQPCGDWTPLLEWNTPSTEHGPSQAAIEATMVACRAYCEPNAKQRFLGVLAKSRGQTTRAPWRLLGETCKAAVSAQPDARYLSAPFFALDRIARAVGDTDPAITVPLPAVGFNGVGVELPSSTAVDRDAGAIAVTIDARDVSLGKLPMATLSSHGLAVTGDYPGDVVALDQLAAKLSALTNGDARPALIIAPHALPAARLVEVIAAARGAALRIAVAAPSPTGWSLPGALPLQLTVASAHGTAKASATIALAPGDKVDDLVAKLTAAIAPVSPLLF